MFLQLCPFCQNPNIIFKQKVKYVPKQTVNIQNCCIPLWCCITLWTQCSCEISTSFLVNGKYLVEPMPWLLNKCNCLSSALFKKKSLFKGCSMCWKHTVKFFNDAALLERDFFHLHDADAAGKRKNVSSVKNVFLI